MDLISFDCEEGLFPDVGTARVSDVRKEEEGGKHGSIWQNRVFNLVLKGFLTLYLIKTL